MALAAEVAHEREQRERAELVERAVDEGDVARAEQALGELAERLERQLARAVASSGAPATRARSSHSASKSSRVELDERVGLLGGGRAPLVDDDERPRSAGGAIQAQPTQQARVGDGRVRPPGDDELGAVADLAEGRRARADRLVGEARAAPPPGSTTAPSASASATARRCASLLVWPRP